MSGRSDSRSETPRSSENQPDDDKQEVSLSERRILAENSRIIA